MKPNRDGMPSRTSPGRVGRLIVITALALAPIWLGGRALVSVTAEPPVREAQSLKIALAAARRARAAEFAPEQMSEAETAAEKALAVHYRTVASKTGFLRYEEVRRHLRQAHEKTHAAWAEARRKQRLSRAHAERLVDEGQAAFAAAEASMRTTPVGWELRADLARARVAVQSASARLKAGDYVSAVREASFAKSTAGAIQRRAGLVQKEYASGEMARKWMVWINETLHQSRQTGDYAILVDKMRRKCHLYKAGKRVKTYSADLGGPLAAKKHAGDRATPEGMYRVVEKRSGRQTIYHKALLINYPNEDDRAGFARAKKNGWIPRHVGIGGLIEIHGKGGRGEDWTLGCVALSNRDMDELFALVAVGTPVTIVGTIGRPDAIES